MLDSYKTRRIVRRNSLKRKNMRRLNLALGYSLTFAMILGLLAVAPARAEDGLNPMIPGGNSAPPTKTWLSNYISRICSELRSKFETFEESMFLSH